MNKKKIIIGATAILATVAAYYLLDVTHGIEYMKAKTKAIRDRLSKKKEEKPVPDNAEVKEAQAGTEKTDDVKA